MIPESKSQAKRFTALTGKPIEYVDIRTLEGHTPGPWELTLNNDNSLMVHTEFQNVLINDMRHRSPEKIKNARLIAAAPALLAEVIERRSRDAAMAEQIKICNSDREFITDSLIKFIELAKNMIYAVEDMHKNNYGSEQWYNAQCDYLKYKKIITKITPPSPARKV